MNASTPASILSHLQNTKLHRLGPQAPAGLLLTSLPWPRSKPEPVSLGGNTTWQMPIGQWIGEEPGTPRRLFLVADGKNAPAPETLPLAFGTSGPAPTTAPPTAEPVAFEESAEPAFYWERHMMVLRQGEKKIGLAMGLRHNDEIHWWEFCRLIKQEATPECVTYEMGGTIPRLLTSHKDLQNFPGYTNPFLHRHNWLHGRITVRAYANGVCEVFAVHVSNKFYDDGLPLEDVVPVIGFRTDWGDMPAKGNIPLDPNAPTRPWDGSQDTLEVGGVKLDLTEVARFANPTQPGSITEHGGFTVLQPYEGCDLYGGICPEDIRGDSYICQSHQRYWPRGMARSLRFSLSLSDRSPKIVRYMAPAWLYGVCEEFTPGSYLTVTDIHPEPYRSSVAYCVNNHIQNTFEDGTLFRHLRQKKDGTPLRGEPSWEGDAPWGLMLESFRTTDATAYDLALRSSYYIADVIVDHASKMMRMHGYPPDGYSLSMNRVTSVIGAYLETADPWLLETAQAVVETSHWTNRNSWPRMGVGRDACYGRGAVMLYRYFADDHYRKIGLYCAQCSAHAQYPEGCYGDQGGGAGIHAWSAYIIKPWMAMLSTQVVLDYLDIHPETPELRECAQRLADWLMRERIDHPEHGIKTWAYQHYYNGGRLMYTMQRSNWSTLPTNPGWYQNNMARLFGFVTQMTGNNEYLDAAEQNIRIKNNQGGDHGVAATLQYLPWYETRLWKPVLTEKGVTLHPMSIGKNTPESATIHTPVGKIRVAWKEGKPTVVEQPEGLQVTFG